MSLRAQVLHWANVRARARDYLGYHSRLLWMLLYPVRSSASSGIWGLDKRVIEVLSKKNGFYIELGANNGYTQSNTLWLEMFHGWRGILIEPVRANYVECLKNRSSKRNKIVRAACVSDTYPEDSIKLSFFDQDVFTRLWARPLGINSTVDNPLLHGRANSVEESNKNYKIEEAPALTLTSILVQMGAPRRIDFMSLDVEGGEVEVLKGLDYAQFEVEWICVETRDLAAVSAVLEPNGYRLNSQLTHHDYMFRLASL